MCELLSERLPIGELGRSPGGCVGGKFDQKQAGGFRVGFPHGTTARALAPGSHVPNHRKGNESYISDRLGPNKLMYYALVP